MFKEKYLIQFALEAKEPEKRDFAAERTAEKKSMEIIRAATGDAMADTMLQVSEQQRQKEERLMVFTEKREDDEAIYNKTVALLESTGLTTAEAMAVLDDDTNPFINWFLSYVENMEKEGIENIKGQKGALIFEYKNGEKGVHLWAQIVLRWKDKIYPVISDYAQDYEEQLELAIEKQTPAVMAIIMDLARSDIEAIGMAEALIAELKSLKEGKTAEQIIEEQEKERRMKEVEEYFSRPYNLPEGGETVIYERVPTPEEIEHERIEAERKQRIDNIKAFMPEKQEFDQLVSRYEGHEGISKEQLPQFQGDMVRLMEGVAQREPKLANLNERLQTALTEVDRIMQMGATLNEAKKLFLPLAGEYEELAAQARATEDYDLQAALDLYTDLAEAWGKGVDSAYNPRDDHGHGGHGEHSGHGSHGDYDPLEHL